jgi:dTMP kinase
MILGRDTLLRMSSSSTGVPPADGTDAAVSSAGWSAYGSLLRDRSFRNLTLAMATSSLGDWIGVLAIIALTESILGEGTRAAAFAVSGVMVARVLPTLVLGPVAGVFVDRWDRKRTMIVVDLGRGTLMCLLAFSNSFLELFFATFAIEVLSLMFAPARDATIPNIVPRERLVHANQLSLFVTYGTLPLGGIGYALLTGAATTFMPELLAENPERVAILLNALTFFVSAPLLLRMIVPKRRNGNGNGRAPAGTVVSGAWEQLLEGFRFVARHPTVRALISGVMAAAFTAGVLFAVGKLFVSIVGAGQTGWGILVAATGIGMVFGLVLAAWGAQRFGNERIFAPGVAVGGLAASMTSLMPRVELAAGWALLMGAGAGVAFVAGYTLLQSEATDDVRGRSFAAFHTGVRAALFVALVAAPFAVGVIGQEPVGTAEYHFGGVRATMLVGGLVAFAGAVWTGIQLHGAPRITPEDLAAMGFGVPDEEEEERGLFIVFEGGEGAGKTTQARRLAAALEADGHDVLVTREPGGTELGERVRELLLDPGVELDPRAEALLHAAIRTQHVDEVIRPALEEGRIVISDRFAESSVVYQGDGRGLGTDRVADLNEWATEGLRPDLVLLLDIDAEVGLGRARGGPDRYEDESIAFHRDVNEAFRRRAKARPGVYRVVDASRDPDVVHEEVKLTVLPRVRSRIHSGDGAGPQPDAGTDAEKDVETDAETAAETEAETAEETEAGAEASAETTRALRSGDRTDAETVPLSSADRGPEERP